MIYHFLYENLNFLSENHRFSLWKMLIIFSMIFLMIKKISFHKVRASLSLFNPISFKNSGSSGSTLLFFKIKLSWLKLIFVGRAKIVRQSLFPSLSRSTVGLSRLNPHFWLLGLAWTDCGEHQAWTGLDSAGRQRFTRGDHFHLSREKKFSVFYFSIFYLGLFFWDDARTTQPRRGYAGRGSLGLTLSLTEGRRWDKRHRQRSTAGSWLCDSSMWYVPLWILESSALS